MKNRTIIIYEKWYTRENPEGEAVLIKRLLHNDIGEYWLVKFISDNFEAQRWIKKEIS